MQNRLITKICANGGVLHYIDEGSSGYIKSNAGHVEGKIDGRLFSFDVGHSWRAALSKYRLPCRLFRLNRINVVRIEDARLLVVYCGEAYIYDILGEQLEKAFKFERTRYVHTQSISVHGARIVIGEYGRVGHNKDIGVFISSDNGVSWQYRSIFPRGATKNILAVKYDVHSGLYWIFTGDSEKESGIFLFDEDFNFVKAIGTGLDFRAISSCFLSSKVIWLTNNPFGVSRVFSYDRATGEINAGQGLHGPVWYSTKVENSYYCCTAAEHVAGEAGKTVYILSSENYQDWELVCKFKKDFFDKRFFLFGLGIFPVHAKETKSLYVNMDAVDDYDGCVIKIEPVGGGLPQ